MSVLNSEFSFDPSFPIHIYEYEVIGQRDSIHWHKYYEIGVCLKGSGKYRYAGKDFTSSAGDIFVTNRYETHVVSANEKQLYIFLVFLPEYFDTITSAGKLLSARYLSLFRYDPNSFENRIPASESCAFRLASLIRQSYDVYRECATGWQMHIDVILRTILFELASFYKKALPQDIPHDIISPQMQAAQVYINEHYNQALTLEMVADAVSLNVSYFRHAFKNAFRQSFKEYLMQVRLTHACTLLTKTNRKINGIIDEVGCSNYTYFYKIFNSHFGMTPAEYRRLNTVHQ